jgi:hypothetical protein
LVNDRVSFQTEGQERVILVCGMFFSHYSVDDPAAEAYATATLVLTLAVGVLAGVYWELRKMNRKFFISHRVAGTILYYPSPLLRRNPCKRQGF